MKKEHKALLELVGISTSGNCLFSEAVQDADWKELFKLACQHGVVAVTWKSIETLFSRDVNCCPLEVKLQWYATAQQQEKAIKEKKQKCLEFIQKLSIPCVVLKGIDYCRFWPDESWRGFGDLDIWLSGRYAEGNEKARSLGCTVQEDYYRHSEFMYNGLMVENHQCLTMHDGTHSGKILETALRNLIRKKSIDESEQIYYPSTEFTALFIIVHAHQHFFFEGLSLKQILDWNFFLKTEGNKVNWREVMPVLKDAGISGFYDIMTAFCVRYLGLRTNLRYESNDSVLSDFTEVIFNNEINCNKASQLIHRFKRMWHFRRFLGADILTRIKNTLVYNRMHKMPSLK